MPTKKQALIFLAIVMLACSASCSREPELPFRVGTNVWPGYEPLYLAESLSFYNEARVKLVEYSSTTEVMRAFRGRELEAAAVTLDEALALAQTDADFKIILVFDYSNGADALLAKPSMKSVKALKGRKVGAETGALGAYVLARALEAEGLNAEDITVVELPADEHERAFEEGRVDAVVTFEPVRTRLVKKGASVLFDSARMPGEIVDVLIVRKGYLSGNREQVTGLLRGWFKALDHMEKEPADAYARMKARLRIGGNDLREAFELIRLPSRQENEEILGGELEKSAGKLMTVMAGSRLIDKTVDIRSLIDSGPIEGFK